MLFVRAHHVKAVDIIHPAFSIISNISLVLLMTLTVVKDLDKLIAEFGTRAYLSAFFVSILFMTAYLVSGSDHKTRLLTGLCPGIEISGPRPL